MFSATKAVHVSNRSGWFVLLFLAVAALAVVPANATSEETWRGDSQDLPADAIVVRANKEGFVLQSARILEEHGQEFAVHCGMDAGQVREQIGMIAWDTADDRMDGKSVNLSAHRRHPEGMTEYLVIQLQRRTGKVGSLTYSASGVHLPADDLAKVFDGLYGKPEHVEEQDNQFMRRYVHKKSGQTLDVLAVQMLGQESEWQVNFWVIDPKFHRNRALERAKRKPPAKTTTAPATQPDKGAKAAPPAPTTQPAAKPPAPASGQPKPATTEQGADKKKE